jgi:hypothetical protein
MARPKLAKTLSQEHEAEAERAYAAGQAASDSTTSTAWMLAANYSATMAVLYELRTKAGA